MDREFIDAFDLLLDRSNFKAAIALARQKIAEQSGKIFYREHLGIALWMSGNRFSAVEELNHAKRLGELSETAELILIHASVSLGQRRVAKSLLIGFLRTRVISRKNLEQLASKFGKLCEFGLALYVCQHLVREYPTNADAWYGIGFYQEQLGFPPEVSVNAMRKAVLLSGCVCSRVHLAKLLSQLEFWREAYLLVHDLPIESLRRVCWAHVVFQIALANQDYALAEVLRERYLLNKTESPSA